MTAVRRSYPLVRLMHCVHCGSTYHGDAGNGYRRVRHARRPACSPSATYRAERYEEQIAALFEGVTLDEADLRQILAAMRAHSVSTAAPDPIDTASIRQQLQRQLDAGEITIETFSRAWRALDRPVQVPVVQPDEVRLSRARELLSDFGTLWRNPAVPDRLREEAIREIFERFDVDGPEIVAAHPQPNESAWLLGLVAVRESHLTTPQGMRDWSGREGARTRRGHYPPELVWRAGRVGCVCFAPPPFRRGMASPVPPPPRPRKAKEQGGATPDGDGRRAGGASRPGPRGAGAAVPCRP